MKISQKKHILILCLIGVVYFIGVAAIVYPLVGNIYSTNSSKEVIQSYTQTVEKMPKAEIDQRLLKAEQYNTALAEGNYDEILSQAINQPDGLMCYVDIPRLHIYLPVYYGTSKEVLEKGCGWLEKTSLPVGGKSTHASVSGHTGLPNAEMFTKLDNAKIGDIFYIHVLNETLSYVVDSINTVTPNDTKHLLIQDGEDYVTLVTCTPYGINDKRLLVRGKRFVAETLIQTSEESAVPQENITQAASRIDDSLQQQIDRDMKTIIIIVSVAVAVFIIACIWLSIVLRRRARLRRMPVMRTKLLEEEHGETKK